MLIRQPRYSYFAQTKPRGDIQETIKFFDDIFKTDTYMVSVRNLLSALKGLK